MSMQKILIIGNLGKDPELKYNQSGKPVTRFSVAVTERRKEGEDETEWFNVVSFGQTAENINKYLHKGSQVFIEGRIKTRRYDKDGKTHYITEMYADNVQFLDRKNAEAGSRASTHNSRQSESQQSEMDDIPFN